MRQEQLQLCKQGEVIRWDMGVRTATDIVLQEPVGVQWAQDAQNVQLRLGVEDVINNTLQHKGEDQRSECQGIQMQTIT